MYPTSLLADANCLGVCVRVASGAAPMAHRGKYLHAPGQQAMDMVRRALACVRRASRYRVDRPVSARPSPGTAGHGGGTDAALRNPTIWINDARAASELLDKRAGIYSSRPRMVVFAELGAGQSNFLNMYTVTPQQRERWRTHRKLMHHGVGVQAVRRYRQFQNNESRLVAADLAESPGDYFRHSERYATSVVSIIAFGPRV